MKSINVSELKANLSRYLRMAAAGTRIIVRDRDDPIAQIGPADAVESWSDRLVQKGWLRRGTQDWANLRITRLDRAIDIQASLRDVREDSSEVRRR